MAVVATGLPPRFDMFSPDLLEDPYPVYGRLREAAAVCRAGPATVAIPRYADVAALLRDPGLGHQLPGRESLTARLPGGAFRNTELSRIVSALDPPDHNRVRRLLARAVSPEVVADVRGTARDTAARLLRVAVRRGQADAVTDIALPLQIAVASHLLGIAPEDRDEVSQQALELGRAIIMVPFVTPERGNGEAQARWMRRYLAGLLDARRRSPAGDVISRLAQARQRSRPSQHSQRSRPGQPSQRSWPSQHSQRSRPGQPSQRSQPGQRSRPSQHSQRSEHTQDDSQLTEDELIDNAVFLFFAGFESSVHLVAGGCAALAQAPAQYAKLAANPELAPSAVEEVLRYDAPLQWISRMTATAVAAGGQQIKAGRVVLLMLGSGNRDERQFSRPDELDISRHPNPHLSFGGGIHHCLGVSIARMLGAEFYGQLAAHCASLALAGPPVRRHHPNLRSYASVPLALTPTAAGR